MFFIPKIISLMCDVWILAKKRNFIVSPLQLKKLQELSLAFSHGSASPKQIRELSLLLAELNSHEEPDFLPDEHVEFITPARFG